MLAPKPSVLVVQHVGHDRKRCCLFGDMFCTIASKLGCVGFVTDANGRDRSAIRERTPDFHVFSTGWVVSHGYGVYIDFNVTVSVCGLTISPGDLLHGDESGLVSVPIDIAADVVKREAVQRRKQFVREDRFNMQSISRVDLTQVAREHVGRFNMGRADKWDPKRRPIIPHE